MSQLSARLELFLLGHAGYSRRVDSVVIPHDSLHSLPFILADVVDQAKATRSLKSVLRRTTPSYGGVSLDVMYTVLSAWGLAMPPSVWKDICSRTLTAVRRARTMHMVALVVIDLDSYDDHIPPI